MEIIASCGESIIEIWDISSGEMLTAAHGHSNMVTCISFSPCGSLLASGSRDGTIVIWDCHTWAIKQTFIKPFVTVHSICFHNSGERIGSAYSDGSIRVWSLATTKEELKIYSGENYSISFNGNSDSIAATCKELIFIYDSFTGEMKYNLESHTDDIWCLQFSKDGNLLASGSYDTTIVIWNMTFNSVKFVLEGHSHAITQVCFDADASRIVSSSSDETARIWDVSTGECLLTLAGHCGCVQSCCFSEDGSKVITACSTDNTIKVWDSDTGEMLRTLASALSGVLMVTFRPSCTGSYI